MSLLQRHHDWHLPCAPCKAIVPWKATAWCRGARTLPLPPPCKAQPSSLLLCLFRREQHHSLSPPTKTSTRVAIGPAPHRVSRALRARNPGRVRKESGKTTVVSKIAHKLYFSELIRRGVIYYAGNFLPQIIVLE